MFDVAFDPARFPALTAWFKRVRALPPVVRDLERARAYMANLATADIERARIFWRGDRLEWLFARGFHAWFAREVDEDRVLWPGPAIPAPH